MGTMPTMKDVAQEAGVALGTVSKVFNGLPVGESCRVRVEKAAERPGYRVNEYARGLRTGSASPSETDRGGTVLRRPAGRRASHATFSGCPAPRAAQPESEGRLWPASI